VVSITTRVRRGIRRRWVHSLNNARILRLGEQIKRQAVPSANMRPVVFFNASTRLTGMSLNASYQLLASWAVRLAGVPTIHLACQGGLSRCVLGTDRADPYQLPPCSECIVQSRAVYQHCDTRWFVYQRAPELEQALEGLGVEALMSFAWQDVPLGGLCLPALRWTLRLHSLVDDEPTRFLYRQYIFSAWNVAREFTKLLDTANPQAVVVFNGMFYPEAVARWTAQQRGVRVITHEVGLRPMTAYFTQGEATAYPIDIPDSFELSPEQNERLDAYLEQRLQGNFSMAGVRFWPEIHGLDPAFLERAAQFSQIVPVFTNVIFDTSQPHSNVVFQHMFAWLDQVLETAKAHPETLFVFRAHPDEARPGKASLESVAEWAQKRAIAALPNVLFVDSREYFSSYELIQRSKFVMVYNSTIGLEAALMGAAVLCAGRARFTQLPIVFFPQTPEEYRGKTEDFLAAGQIEVPPDFKRNARRFLYYQLYKTSLPFDSFLEEDGVWTGYVRIKDLAVKAFRAEHSPTLRVIVDGILDGQSFLLEN
jgi:hypothetical protein